jgi:transcriptional regulator with XRE-family HTH domain
MEAIMAPPSGFGVRLRTMREAAGLTQAQLGERAGMMRSVLARLELGMREPTWPTVLALSAALGCEPNDFWDGPASAAPPRRTGRPAKPAEDPPATPKRPRRPRGG